MGIGVELAAVALIATVALGFDIGRKGIASGYVDPTLQAGAQDEAVYGHAAVRMVRTGEWATPVFLDRFLLNKPPLLEWAGAASLRVAGGLSSDAATILRLPVVGAGVLICVLLYAWVRRSKPAAAAFAGVLLLLGSPVFFSMSRRFMTDAMLALFVVAAMFVMAADPRLERWASGVALGAFSGAAVMTKSAAGVLPLLIAVGYWILADAQERPRLRKLAIAFAVAAIVAAPWHVYQFVVHRDWFVAEYIRFQLLGSGVTAPSRYTSDTNFWFYLKTLVRTDPILLALWASSIPWMVKAWKGAEQAQARLLAVWFVMGALALGIFGTRAAYYLMPLLPVLVLMSAEFSPLLRGRLGWIVCAALVIAFAVRLDYGPATVPPAAALEDYAQMRRTNELVIVSPDDEFYASVLDLPRVRYVYLTPLDPTKTSEFFYRLGMIVSGEDLCALNRSLPVYEARLRAWKLPEGLHPEATLIDAAGVSKLAELIRCSPDRDFLVPENLKEIATEAGEATHIIMPAGGDRFFLLAKNSSRRAADSIAPGTLVRTRLP
jgi:Dolichyl-phosphate-mannose-protein mannosyltransferase